MTQLIPLFAHRSQCPSPSCLPLAVGSPAHPSTSSSKPRRGTLCSPATASGPALPLYSSSRVVDILCRHLPTSSWNASQPSPLLVTRPVTPLRSSWKRAGWRLERGVRVYLSDGVRRAAGLDGGAGCQLLRSAGPDCGRADEGEAAALCRRGVRLYLPLPRR